jgi:hypothetical protein
MSHNLKPEEGHLERTDRFRFEEDFPSENLAFENARTRSLNSFKTITMMLNTKTGMYTTHSHGIPMIDTIVIATFKRGVRTTFATLCGECTGSQKMAGGIPCKVCRGTGYETVKS